MSNPTAAELLERLRSLYEAETGTRLSDEKLAARLPITLSTFNRWKRSDTDAFRSIIEMLDAAGWLSIDDPASPKRPLTEDELERARRAHAELSGLLRRLQEATGE